MRAAPHLAFWYPMRPRDGIHRSLIDRVNLAHHRSDERTVTRSDDDLASYICSSLDSCQEPGGPQPYEK